MPGHEIELSLLVKMMWDEGVIEFVGGF